MANQQHKGLQRLLNAARYSWEGLKVAWQHEEAFRQESILCLILIPIAFWLGENGIERALMIGSVLLVIIVELINSAVETIVDRISIERHELSKRAKDIGSAAVFVALANVAAIWLLLIFDF